MGRREYSKHMLRLRREGNINGKDVPEIILLNSHDDSSSYQMIPGIFRFVCTNGLVCGNNFGEIRVPHKGDIVGQVIEGAYEVLGVFDKVTENMEAMKEIHLNSDEQHLFGRAALMARYEDENKTPVTPEQIIPPRRWEDKQNDLWTTWQRVQENMIKGGLSVTARSQRRTIKWHNPTTILHFRDRFGCFQVRFNDILPVVNSKIVDNYNNLLN